MIYFESHAHPDHPLVEDKHEYICAMRKSGIGKLVVAPTTYDSNYSSMEFFPGDEYPDVFFAKGIHPKYAQNEICVQGESLAQGEFLWPKKELERFTALLKSPRVVAIKSGLDFCQKNAKEEQIQRQYDFLKMFMDMAYEHHKPLVLHIRNAAEEAIDFFRVNPIRVPAEVHCFTYDKDIMQLYINVGIKYFGIGGMITRDDNDMLCEAVLEMPLEMILLESDAPFVKVHGETQKINTSDRSIPVVAKKIAQIKGISEEEVAKVTYNNACKFFNLKE